MKIEVIPVAWTRPTRSIFLQAAFELAKQTEPISQMHVGMKHETLEEIAVFVLRSLAPE